MSQRHSDLLVWEEIESQANPLKKAQVKPKDCGEGHLCERDQRIPQTNAFIWRQRARPRVCWLGSQPHEGGTTPHVGMGTTHGHDPTAAVPTRR